MAVSLPPPPSGSPPGDWAWLDWYRQVADYVGGTDGAIAWSSVDKTGSDLTDLAARAHSDLQTIQGGTSGEYYHLTSDEHNFLSNLDDVVTYTSGDSPVTLVAGSSSLILADTSGGTITINLPTASGVKRFHIKKIGGAANAVTINRAGADTIEGGTSVSTSTDYVSWTIYADGSATWYIQSTT
jgi:hypothetical protein